MDKEVKEIISRYQYSRDIKKYSNHYFFQDDDIFSRVNNNRDVQNAQNRVESNLRMLSKVFPLERVDVEELEKDMGRYELAVAKVIQCFDNPRTDFNYTAEELQQLINSVFSFYDKIDNVNMRRLCQD
ncbi:hypothetical protein [Aneurinibacillus tyrosinisolvens]|uniref:hypothetical protein n=1 Tax=Aneurinibacillus tyrosinisolvens TaxID=1443435 RepID=UPI00063FAF0A|nr:hypothetical protein [Aneurinibacillus tyrosinisolvens]